MLLLKTLPKQAKRSMVIATRRGTTWYVYGSNSKIYRVQQGDYGTLTCTCPDYERRRVQWAENCKHGDLIVAKLNKKKGSSNKG